MAWRGVPHELWGRVDWPNQDVVGESEYLPRIRQAFLAAAPPDSDEAAATALLLPEPRNPTDRNAVAVAVHGQVVGYLPREAAARYAPVLRPLVDAGRLPMVPASLHYQEIAAAGDLPEVVGSVRISLDEPHALVPRNTAPIEPHLLLSGQHTVEVTDMRDHLAALVQLLPREGEAWFYATLHEVAVKTSRGEQRAVIEVGIDGARMGRLPRPAGEQFLPVVREVTGRGLLPAARALLVKGSGRARLVLYADPAGLPARWPDTDGREQAEPVVVHPAVGTYEEIGAGRRRRPGATKLIGVLTLAALGAAALSLLAGWP